MWKLRLQYSIIMYNKIGGVLKWWFSVLLSGGSWSYLLCYSLEPCPQSLINCRPLKINQATVAIAPTCLWVTLSALWLPAGNPHVETFSSGLLIATVIHENFAAKKFSFACSDKIFLHNFFFTGITIIIWRMYGARLIWMKVLLNENF